MSQHKRVTLSFVMQVLLLAVSSTSLCVFSGDILAAEEKPAPEKTKTVTMVIDYGDGVQKHFTSIPWKADLTVLDVMIRAKSHPHGIQLVFRGKGSTAFLTQIDDLKNEGRGKNWLFSVNGKLAKQSFAIEKLKPADAILWKFGKYK